MGGLDVDFIGHLTAVYFGIMSFIVFVTLIYSILGTGWCGEKIAHYTDEAFDAGANPHPKPHRSTMAMKGDFTRGAGCCGCMLACCVRCFYCTNVCVLYIMIFTIFLSVIMQARTTVTTLVYIHTCFAGAFGDTKHFLQALLSFLCGVIFVIVGLLYGVCRYIGLLPS